MLYDTYIYINKYDKQFSVEHKHCLGMNINLNS